MNRLLKIKDIIEKASPVENWGPYTANIPFYAIVNKPSPSLSKHDLERSEYWKVEDAVFVAMARRELPKLIDDMEVAFRIISGLLETGRECANDYVHEDKGYYFWAEKAKELINK